MPSTRLSRRSSLVERCDDRRPLRCIVDAVAAADRLAYDRLVATRPSQLEGAIALTANAGRGALAWIAAAALVRTQSRSLPLVRCAATTWTVYAGSLALARIIRRPRPYEGRNVCVLIERPQGPSLPSDQVAAAFAAAPFLAHAVPRAGLAIYAGAAMMGACRVLAGVHYPGDVIVAALLGVAAEHAGRR